MCSYFHYVIIIELCAVFVLTYRANAELINLVMSHMDILTGFEHLYNFVNEVKEDFIGLGI